MGPNPKFTGANLLASACNARLGLVADAQGLTNTRSRVRSTGRFETEQAEGLRIGARDARQVYGF